MLTDLRAIVLALAFLASSIVVALAEPSSEETVNSNQRVAEARPIRVILPAPWETSRTPVTPSTAPQK